jgi:hypothetical protein
MLFIKNHLIGLYWRVKRFFYKTATQADIAPATVPNPLLKWPRNFNCVCGSGKKFKKCCLNGLNSQVTIKDANAINKKLEKYRV